MSWNGNNISHNINNMMKEPVLSGWILTCSWTSRRISSLLLVERAAQLYWPYPAGSWCGSSGMQPRLLGVPGLLPLSSLCTAPIPARATPTSRKSAPAGTADCSSSPAGGSCTDDGACPVFWGLFPPGWGLHHSGERRSPNQQPPLLWLVLRMVLNIQSVFLGRRNFTSNILFNVYRQKWNSLNTVWECFSSSLFPSNWFSSVRLGSTEIFWKHLFNKQPVSGAGLSLHSSTLTKV